MVLVIQNIEGSKAGRILLCRKLNFQRSAHQASPLDLIHLIFLLYYLNDGLVMSSSMFVVDDERQCQKMTDEDVLKRQLDALNSDYAMLQMQSEELRVRKQTQPKAA